MTTPNFNGFDAILDDLAETPEERQVMLNALHLLAYAVPQVEAPASLRQRVIGQPHEAPTFERDGSYFAIAAELPWVRLTPDVELKDLHAGPSGARTTLIRMAPNSSFPPHPHGFVEDLYLISGDAWVGDVYMVAGDYCRAPEGSEHNHVRSGDSGALALVVSR